MIIYDPKITGSFDVNGTSISSLDQIDVTSGSVSSLNDATSSYALIAEISGSTTSLSSSLASELLKNTTDTLTGDLTVTGTLTAQDLHVQEVTSSIVFSSGSNKFGENVSNTHEFTGSLNLTGSITYGGSGLNITGQSSDGSDNQAFFIAAGGGTSDSRGAYIWARGNEATNGGRIQINAGNTATGDILLYTGGSVRMYISSSGTIGVGTSNPLTNLLSIRGYGAIDSNANQGLTLESNHYYDSVSKYINNGYASIISQDTGGTYAGYIRFQQAGLNSSGAGATMTLTDSMVIDQSGNLQIATTALSGSADPRVSVYSKGYYYDGSGNGLGDFHIGNGTYGLSTGVALGGGGAGDVRIWTTGGAHKLIFGTGGGDRVYLKSNGYLGLGVYDPSHKLQVLIGAGDGTGLGLLNTSGQGLKIFTDTTAANADVYIQQGASGAAMIFRQTTNERMRIDSSGRVSVNDTVSGNFLTNYDTKLLVGGEVIARSLTANESMVSIGGDSNGAFIKSGKQDGSLTDRPLNLITGEDIRISIASSGNVGIGTTSVPTLLTLDASAENQSAPSQALRINGPNTPGNSNSAQQIVWAFDYAGSARIQAFREASWGTSMQFLTNAPAEGSDSPQVRLHIDESGNVGINATSPAEKLEVDGSIRVNNYIASDHNFLSMNQRAYYNTAWKKSSSGRARQLQLGTDYSGALEYRISNVDGGSAGDNITWQSIFVANDNGNIGIGTTDPSDALVTVKGGGNPVGIGDEYGHTGIKFYGAQTGQLEIFNNRGNSTYGNIIFTNSSVESMRIDASNRVGIGTDSPSGQFHSYISATRYFGHNVNSGDLSVVSDNNSAPVFKVQGTGTADLVNILDNTSQVFTIKDGGNVGIGTTSPSADLHINDGEGAAIVYQGSKRGKMIGKTIQRHTAGTPKTDLFTINSFQSGNSNLYAVVTVLYVSPTSTNGGKASAQFWIDNDNQSSPTVGSFTHEQQVGSASFSLEWDNTNKILKFVPASANYWYYVVDVEYVAFDGASVTFNTSHSYNEE